MGARQSQEMREALRLLRKDPTLSRAEAARRAGLKSRSSITKHFNKTKEGTNRNDETS